MDPAGTIVVSLAMGAAATVGKTAVAEVVKDAYGSLRKQILSRFPAVQIELLESAPLSEGPQEILKEELTKDGVQNDPDILAAAHNLIALIKENEPEAASGLIFTEVEAARLTLSNIASSGTGVRVEKSKFTDINIHGVRAGIPGKERRRPQ